VCPIILKTTYDETLLVIPAKAGIQISSCKLVSCLDSRLRGNDSARHILYNIQNYQTDSSARSFRGGTAFRAG
ncbi:MAG: hypothetical protein V2A61_06950, partial [Calditrichota bacterium]